MERLKGNAFSTLLIVTVKLSTRNDDRDLLRQVSFFEIPAGKVGFVT